jgi:hypothetical protein
MDRPTALAIAKLAACTTVALALLVVWIFGGDLWYRPIAAVAFIIVGAPVVPLVSIDTGRVLRRQPLSRVATIATRAPRAPRASSLSPRGPTSIKLARGLRAGGGLTMTKGEQRAFREMYPRAKRSSRSRCNRLPLTLPDPGSRCGEAH